MDIGSHVLCLKTEDVDRACTFYKALGMKINVQEHDWAWLSYGTFHLSVMSFLEEDCLNFRGADVQAVYDHMKAQGFDLEGTPVSGSSNTAWQTRDPDGNVIFFDTNEKDAVPHRIRGLLKGIEMELHTLGIESQYFAAFKEELQAHTEGDDSQQRNS